MSETFHEMRPSIGRQCLHIILCDAASESLLLGKVVGIVQGREIGDSLFCLVARIRIDDLDPISRGECIQEIHHSDLVVLIEPASAFAGLKRSFDDEKSERELQELFEFAKKGQAIIGGIREDRIEFFHSDI